MKGNRDTDEQPPPVELAQKAVTLSLLANLSQVFQTVFNPQAEQYQPPQINRETLQQAERLLPQADEGSSLLARSKAFVKDSKSTMPGQKTDEYNTAVEAIVRVGMVERPAHFAPIMDHEEVVEDDKYAIGFNFLTDFMQGGGFQRLEGFLKNKISEEPDLDKKSAISELVDGFSWFLKHISSDAVKDPLQDPLLAGMNQDKILEFFKLQKFVSQNQDDENYDAALQRYDALKAEVRRCKDLNMKATAQKYFSLIKRLDPQHSELASMEDLEPHIKQKHLQSQRVEFIEYIEQHPENQFQDIFEPNRIRRFHEELYRKQYGRIWHQMICESFEEENRNSQIHQTVQSLWRVSLLDTLHDRPADARSRMPSASVDGKKGPNFGYRMSDSPAYKAWIGHPLARACGDIIVDAFYQIADFGSKLNIELFLNQFNDYLNDPYHDPNSSYFYTFSQYLLNKVLNLQVESENVVRVLGEQYNDELTQSAKAALTDFKSFSQQMNMLRATNIGEHSDKDKLGLVFGIGFNGEVFGVPHHSSEDNNEIHITFSSAGRKLGGYLSLYFIKQEVRHPHRFENSPINALIYKKYRHLIRQNLKVEILEHSRALKEPSPKDKYRDYIKEKIELENYLTYVSQNIPFDEITPEFIEWLNQSENWYYIPSLFDICIPDEIPVPEVAPQQAVREMIFDMIVREQFVEKYPDIQPLLFLHWKNEILHSLSENEGKDSDIIRIVTDATSLEDTEPFQPTVLLIMNKLALNLDEYMKDYWLNSITKEFNKKIMPEREKLATKSNSVSSNLYAMQNRHLPNAMEKRNDTSIVKLNATILKLEEERNQIIYKLDHLPKKPSELSDAEYLEFRRKFFEKRDVSQCIEPVFARVLGHDRFYSVFISRTSKKTNITELLDGQEVPLQLGNQPPLNVINPCDKRCQFHPLAHLFTGDMLLYQSADKLDQIRKTHSVESVPDRMMTFKSVRESIQPKTEVENELFTEDDNTTDQGRPSPINSPRKPLILMRSPSFWSQPSAPQQHDAAIVDETVGDGLPTKDLAEADFFNQFEDDFDDLKI